MTLNLPGRDRRQGERRGSETRDARLTLSLSGTNLERAGDYNQRIVLQAIRMDEETTRSDLARVTGRSEEHTSVIQALMRISYAVLCLKKITPIYLQQCK